MSKAFYDKYGMEKQTRETIREFVRLSCPHDEDGKPIYITEQEHLKECDVNLIIKKYDATGLISHVNNMEAMYGDIKSMDFREALELQKKVGEDFLKLPSDIRRIFGNDPANYLAFMEDPSKRQESIELGLRPMDVKPTETPLQKKNKTSKGQDSPEP